jgi:hypothetical protein
MSSQATIRYVSRREAHVIICDFQGDGRTPRNQHPPAPFASAIERLFAGILQFVAAPATHRLFLFRSALVHDANQSASRSPISFRSPFVMFAHKRQHTRGVNHDAVKP